jgi:DNA ligase-1
LEATNGDLGRLGIFSRNGKQFHHLNHIVEDLASSLLPGEIVDGELYVHGMPFQTIISSIKREQASNAKIKLRVYDMAHVDEDLSQTRRLRRAKRICRNAGASVEFCPTYIVNNLEEVKKLFAQFIEEGYEGIILRNMDNTYEFGKRSKFMAKYKEFDDDEFLIIGVNEATGRDEGTAIFVCKAKNGQEFRARPMGTRELRAEYYNFPQKYIGKKLTVKYQGLSEEGIPRFPIGKSIRDYE